MDDDEGVAPTRTEKGTHSEITTAARIHSLDTRYVTRLPRGMCPFGEWIHIETKRAGEGLLLRICPAHGASSTLFAYCFSPHRFF